MTRRWFCAVVVHDVELLVAAPVAVGGEGDPGQERPGLPGELADDVVGDDVRHPPDRDPRGGVLLSEDRAEGPEVEQLGRDDDARPLRLDLGVQQELGAGGDPGVALLPRRRRPEPLRVEGGIREDEPGGDSEVSREGRVERVDEVSAGRSPKRAPSPAGRPARCAGPLPGSGRGRCRRAARGGARSGAGCCPESGASTATRARLVTKRSETHRGPPAVLHWKRM